MKPTTPMRGGRRSRLKPTSPMRGGRRSRLKPTTPMRGPSSPKQAHSRPQRRCRFHEPSQPRPQRRRRFHEQPTNTTGSTAPRPRLPSPRLIHRRDAERQLSTGAQFQLFISLSESDHPSIRPISAATHGGGQLLPELVTSVRSSLRVVGIHGTKVQLHRLRKNGDVLRILPGIYLPAEILTVKSCGVV